MAGFRCSSIVQILREIICIFVGKHGGENTCVINVIKPLQGTFSIVSIILTDLTGTFQDFSRLVETPVITKPVWDLQTGGFVLSNNS